jgi:hypothetical protein
MSPGGNIGNICSFIGASSGCAAYAAAEFGNLAGLGLNCWEVSIESAWHPLKHQWMRLKNKCSGASFDSKAWNLAWPKLEKFAEENR